MPDFRVVETDILIVGSEGAGARAAIEACRTDESVQVVVTTKGPLARSGATLTAGTDINMDGKSMFELFGFEGESKDTKDIYFEDIVVEGRYVNNQKLIEVLVERAPRAVKEVADWGMEVMGYWRAAGHRQPRGVLSTGVAVMVGLKKKLNQYKDRISLHEFVMVTDLIKDDNGIISGAVALDLKTGTPVVYIAKSTILASGGGLRIYPWTSGPEDLTGDGHAMAYRQGAEFVDMEFVQFITCTLQNPPSKVKSVNPLLNLGGWLLNAEGQRFMARWDPRRMEQSTRDNIAIGIMMEILEGRGFEDESGGYVLISLKHLPDQIIELNKGINAFANYKDLLNRLKGGAAKCFPACHFYCGGLRINEKCETNIPGLYAAGEVAGGIHGANRLSGNAITEVLVYGGIAGKEATGFATNRSTPQITEDHYGSPLADMLQPYKQKEGSSAIKLRKQLQRLAGTNVGVVRDEALLKKAISQLQDLKEQAQTVKLANHEKVYNREWLEALELRNMAQTLAIVAHAALTRQESRGTHYRRDFTETDNQNWLQNIVVKKADTGKLSVAKTPAKLTKVLPS